MDRNTWQKYIELASRLSDEAGEMMTQFIADNPQITPLGLVNYAYGLVTKYGEANSALAAEVYDACATAAGVDVAAAEVVETPYSDVAKAVYATISSPDNVSGAVSRLVKRAGADTTLRNAARDGAEFAWVPSGDTCAFCIMLASNGWRTISKKSLKNGHAEHIHAHCDCQYAVRFDSRTNVEGYDPDEYLRQYREAGGDVNAMRREQYAQNKDVINAQHRVTYRNRNADSMGMAKRFEDQSGLVSIKAYEVEGHTSLYTQTYSADAQNTINLLEKYSSNIPMLEDVSETIIAKDLPGIAAYDHAENRLFVNELVSNYEYIAKQLENRYFIAENVEDILRHEMFHKQNWDYIESVALTSGKESAIVKQDLERELMSYVQNQIAMQPSYLRTTVSTNAYVAFIHNGSLNETIAEVMLQDYKHQTKDPALLELVKRVCI